MTKACKPVWRWGSLYSLTNPQIKYVHHPFHRDKIFFPPLPSRQELQRQKAEREATAARKSKPLPTEELPAATEELSQTCGAICWEFVWCTWFRSSASRILGNNHDMCKHEPTIIYIIRKGTNHPYVDSFEGHSGCRWTSSNSTSQLAAF